MASKYRGLLILFLIAFPLMLPPVMAQSTPARALGQRDAPRLEIRRAVASDPTATALPSTTGMPATDDKQSELIPWWEGQSGSEGSVAAQKSWSTTAKVEMGVDHDDNVRINEDHAESTNGYFIRPSVGINWGHENSALMLSALYSPEFRIYDGGNLSNTFNQAATIAGSLRGARSRMTGTVSYAHTDGADVDVGDRVELDNILATLNGSYDLGMKAQVGLSLETNSSQYESYDSYVSNHVRAHLDYSVTPKLTLGAEGGYDHVDLDLGSTQQAFNVSGRIKWQATAKIGVDGTIGVENREFEGGGDSRAALTYRMGISYSPRIRTRIRGDVYRSTNPSVSVVDESYYATGVALTLEQELSARIRFSLAAGYEQASYFDPHEDDEDLLSSAGSGQREDRYFFARPQITYVLNEWLSISLFYQYTENDSTDGSDDSFVRNQIGLYATIAF